ncbi:MAG: heavy metal translocating P-type ATPase [Nitrososphaeraceae archaeon]|nr:heavy metal translocating P-type ATPase [Nitrososphaeraceae archaeon]
MNLTFNKFFLIFIKRYPIPIFAIIGLIFGSLFHWFYNEHIGHWIWIGTLLIGGIPIIFWTIRDIIHRRFATDIIAMLAIITAILSNEALPGVVIVIMQSGGKALEDYAFRKVTASLDALLANSPRQAHRKKNNMIEEIDVNSIKIGDVLVVRPGDLIPIDGHLIIGNNNATIVRSVVDESALTGEPIPKTKKAGDLLFSGTVNVGDAFEMIADKLSEESQYSKIVTMVRKAQEEKAPIQRIADRYAIWFTPITIFISFFGFLITGKVETILSVLVVASPCSLIFATPIAIIGGINKCAKLGIIIKSGLSLEKVGKAESIVFDKTGTITFGSPTIETIISLYNTVNSDDILLKAGCVEQLSSHPTAKVITKKAQEKYGELTIPDNFHEIPGIGVEGFLNGEHIVIGSQSILENIFEKQELKNILNLKKNNQFKGKMLAFVNIDDRPVGIIVFGDIIRTGVKSMIDNFKSIGVKEIMILSGDSYENSQIIAQEIGVNSFEANLLPEDKLNSIKKLKKRYKNVIMIGDGINDAPALAVATVGIAMGAHGTAISAEAADIVLLVDDVTKVVDTLNISKRTIHIAKQSIYVGLGASFIFMLIASFGFIPPTVGAIIQELMDVAVIINALRAR